MSKRLFMYLTVFLVVCVMSFIVTRRVRTQDVSHKAFTAVQIEKRYDGAGVEQSEETRLYAVRSDGSSVMFNRRPGPDGRFYQIGSVYDVARRTVTTIDGLTESTTTENMGAGALEFRKSIERNCTSGSEHSKVMGWDAVKMNKMADTPGRLAEWTEWAAPDLDCFVLSSTAVLSIPKGSPVARNTTETQFLMVGEPQASLFVAPQTYKERSPSEVADEYARRFGERPFGDSVLQRSEETYQSRHK
jgi:hypothetical protein